LEGKLKLVDLKELGLVDCFKKEASLYEDLYIARVAQQHRDLYKVICEKGELQAKVSGKFSYNTCANTDYPVVGDWVMIDRTDDKNGDAIIHQILTRKSVFERRAAGTANQSQIVASNIDVIFICMALNNDFNLRRLERYLSIAWNSGAIPVIVLTKSDLCEDLSTKLAEVHSAAIGTDVLVTSSVDSEGYSEVYKYIQKGKTIAFIGSSGVGKSTMINSLIRKELLTTNETRKDDRGRHTTSSRQLIVLQNGGVVIDTPGMRELHLENADFSKSFEDIEEMAKKCKFKDCTHTTEPGCNVIKEVESGNLSEKRLENYKKLRTEVSYEGLNSRQVEQAKIKRMFGGKSAMKQAMDCAKNKNKMRR
jgi:ribosome biogenesis GTPase